MTLLLLISLAVSVASESFGSLSVKTTLPSSGSINYGKSVLKDNFVINGSWWSLSTVYGYIYNLSVAYSTFVRREKIGVSYSGYNIYALVIGLGSKYMTMDGAIHGNEKTGTFGALAFANFLIRNWQDPYWNSRLHRVAVIMVPVLNPDGFVKNSYDFNPPDGGGLNGAGQNLNRQFPPGCTNTTAPEALAYLNLWAKYHPSVLVSHHTGQLNIVYWSQYMDSWDDTLTRYALQVANQSFVTNGHTETTSNGTWLGKMYSFRQAGYDDMTVAGAGYLYGAVAVLPEFWRPYPMYADVGIDYYLQIDKAMLSHLDNTVKTATAYSSSAARIVGVTENTTNASVTLHLDASSTSTVVRIYFAAMPTKVIIDGVTQKDAILWQYDSTTKIVKVESATDEITLFH